MQVGLFRRGWLSWPTLSLSLSPFVQFKCCRGKLSFARYKSVYVGNGTRWVDTIHGKASGGRSTRVAANESGLLMCLVSVVSFVSLVSVKSLG